MSTGGTIALVVGVLAIFYLAINRGLINSGVQVGIGPGGVTSARGIVAPQPSSNYGGYLAASTAPGVASALNGALTGIGSSLASWVHGSPAPAGPAPAQGASYNSPSMAAQPSGPVGSYVAGSTVGPVIDPVVSYDATSGAAFDYPGLAADNGYDASVALSNA